MSLEARVNAGQGKQTRHFASLSSRSIAFLLVSILFGVSCFAQAPTERMPRSVELYDKDPQHLLNRLHRALFVRTGTNGVEYGFDELDPLLWPHTKHLLESPSHDVAIKLLDEFLRADDSVLPHSPVKRALLQRDLWAVFDWIARPYRRRENPSLEESGYALRVRLAAAIRRLALTREQIEKLPDNYQAAIKSRTFATHYDKDKPETPFLPPDLLSTNGSWVGISCWNNPLAASHVAQFGGRSAFQVFLQLPGGRDETLIYVKQLAGFPQPWIYKVDTNVWVSSNGQTTSNKTYAALNPNLPQFPDGTTLALVRRAFLIDQTGELVPSPLIESIQMRRYNDAHAKPGAYGMAPANAQAVFEFVLNRQQLFNDVRGGLRAVGRDEKNFRQFMSKGFDPFEHGSGEFLKPAYDCRVCHAAPGLRSVNSFVQRFEGSGAYLPIFADTTGVSSQAAVVTWKKGQYSWGLLQGLWEKTRDY